MRRIALATSNEYADLTKNDRALLDKLLFWGVDVEPIVWTSEDVTWNQYDAVFIRSCWDYHLNVDRFFDWVNTLEQEGVAVFNPPRIMRWNSNKKYLRDLQDKEIAIAPTVWLTLDSRKPLRTILSEQNWERAVVKPNVSANAHDTWLSSAESAEEAVEEEKLQEMLRNHGEVMVQKFLPQIKERGEWAFVFFEGTYSHAVLKKPKADDFRVQDEYGGVILNNRPSRELVSQAAKVIEVIEDPGLYARVDAVEVDRKLQLLELEMIEPSLYLDRHPKAVQRFADSILGKINSLALPTDAPSF